MWKKWLETGEAKCFFFFVHHLFGCDSLAILTQRGVLALDFALNSQASSQAKKYPVLSTGPLESGGPSGDGSSGRCPTAPLTVAVIQSHLPQFPEVHPGAHAPEPQSPQPV